MNKGRPLTAGETAAAYSVFANSLDYSRITIHQGFYRLPLTAACAPNGRIYFPSRQCADDFSCAAASQQIWLIHELAHVWQWQHGYRPWLGGLILAVQGGYFRRAAYRIPPDCATRPFAALNMEQQAVALEQLFILKRFPHIRLNRQHIFQTAIRQFAENPSHPALLPRYFCHVPHTFRPFSQP